MLPTRREIAKRLVAGLSVVFFGGSALALAGAGIVFIGFLIWQLALVLVGVYRDTGPVIFAAPFIVLMFLYVLYVLGSVGLRKNWWMLQPNETWVESMLYRDEKGDTCEHSI